MPGQRLRLTWPPQGFELEARASRKPGEALWVRRIKVLVWTFFAFVVMRFGIKVGGFIPAKYTRELIDNSDFRKFDDSLRMVLDCTRVARRRDRGASQGQRREGILRYGTHRQHAAMMTCFTPSPTQCEPRAFHRRRDGRLCDGGKRAEELLTRGDVLMGAPNPDSLCQTARQACLIVPGV